MNEPTQEPETPLTVGGTEERIARLEQELRTLTTRLDEREAQKPQPASDMDRSNWRNQARTRWEIAHHSFRRSSIGAPVLAIVVGLVAVAAILIEVID